VATVVLAYETIKLAQATATYTRYMRQANVTAYFDASGNWINLIIQNTGTGLATAMSFTLDLTPEELNDIYGPNKHGSRYIVFETLDFLESVRQLAPGQTLRHRWLHRWIALREKKPRPCVFRATYSDDWGRKHTTEAQFTLRSFGTWDGTNVMEPPPLDSMADSLRTIAGKK
jgi:hypothetical protein